MLVSNHSREWWSWLVSTAWHAVIIKSWLKCIHLKIFVAFRCDEMIVVFYIELHDNMARDHMTLAGLFEPGRGTPSAFERRLAGTLVCTAAGQCPQLWDPMLSLHNIDLCIDTSHVISYLTI